MRKSLAFYLSAAILLVACVGCSGTSGRGAAVVNKLATGMPRSEAEAKVKEFEASLAKKSPQFDREKAWRGFEAEADRILALRKEQKAANEAKATRAAQEDMRYAEGRATWEKWINSKRGSGHFVSQLAAMRRLGRRGVEKATGAKFQEVKGHGKRLYFELPSGVRFQAADYGNQSSAPLTGFTISLSPEAAAKFKGKSIFEILELPSGEFREVKLELSPEAYRWKKLAKPLGYESDLDWDPDKQTGYLYWAGP